jgi:antitoxin ParD1/3/4
MSDTEELKIAVPSHLADMVRDKVRSGAYGTESEVISEGLRALKEREDGIERWLREEVAGTLEAYRRDPARTVPAESVVDGLEARYLARKAKNRLG